MGFAAQLEQWPFTRMVECIKRATIADVDRALAREERGVDDLAALLSPVAAKRLEEMAREAQRLTRWHFGRTIGMYVPLYLSNICGADCAYCGYSVRSGIRLRRLSLTEEQIHHECRLLAAEGFQSVLLLTGEAPRAVPLSYIGRGVEIAREYFPSVAVEIYSLDRGGYAELCARGIDGVTIYMETYNRDVYRRVHLLGQKKDYDFRLDAIEHAGLAGVRRLSIGALLGLTEWRTEAFALALHGQYLQKRCWQSALSVSFPRLRHVPPRFRIPRLMLDKELVQMMLALRLFLPTAGFNLSTRESPEFRDRLIPLGVTMMSAGSSTRPGGYGTHGDDTLEQFETEDHRSVTEVAEAIRRAGYEPVWKDFDYAFDTAAATGA